MTVLFSSFAAWDIAKRIGCGYTGDANPIDHGGTFYDVRDWERYGYASCVRFTRIDDTLHVECATVNRPSDLTDCYACCGFARRGDKLVASQGEIDITPEVEIECVLAYWGAEPVEDYSGRMVQRFAEETDEDDIWQAVSGWLSSLGCNADCRCE